MTNKDKCILFKAGCFKFHSKKKILQKLVRSHEKV